VLLHWANSCPLSKEADDENNTFTQHLQKEASTEGARQVDLPSQSSAVTLRTFLHRSAGAMGAMLAAPAAAPAQTVNF